MACMLFGRRHVTALLALILLASIPAAAQARNYKVDGRVAGPPTAKRGTVSVPLQLTARSGRALKLGTRRVRVRFRRMRLPLAGAAGRRRVAPRALLPGDRMKGVTSLSKKTRLRLRYRARPTLKLRRPRVIRAVRRRRAAPFVPAPMVAPGRTPEQIVNDIGARATALSGRIGRFSSLSQQVSRLQTLRLPVGLAGVTVAFESLTTALEDRAGTDPDFAPLVAEVEAIAPGADWLGTAMGAVDTSVRITHVLITIGDAVETLAVDSVMLVAHIELLKQVPGVLAQLIAIEDALARVDSRLAAVEAASGALDSGTRQLNDGMGSLTDATDAMAASAEAGAELASLSTGVDALATDVTGLDSGFGALQTSLDATGPELDGLAADAATLEAMVEALEALGIGGG
jgi:hypothetical protein